jgi:nitroreductase
VQESELLAKIIAERRSIYPSSYSTQPVTRAEIDAVLEAANWAPTHKRTEPWRFVVMHSIESRALLGNHMAEYYRLHTQPAEFVQLKYDKPIKNTELAGCIIAIILHRDAQERLPEWEEMCAVAAAVQNMWLTCTSMQLGAYWSSHGSIKTAKDILQLTDNEQCIGYFFIGHTDAEAPLGRRGNIQDKVRFI